jgi:single-strand DNA-binding protein
MNDLTITVTGWVATEPRHVVGPTGTRLTSFRLASTSRYFDRDKGEWADGNTEWFTVRTFRSAAITVKNSITKGQPVLVNGRLRTHEWDADAGPRTDLVIDASSVGHDLTKGVAVFTRATGDASLTDGRSEPSPDESDIEVGVDSLPGDELDAELADETMADAPPTDGAVVAA